MIDFGDDTAGECFNVVRGSHRSPDVRQPLIDSTHSSDAGQAHQALVEGLFRGAPHDISDREVDFLRALENGKQSFRLNRVLSGTPSALLPSSRSQAARSVSTKALLSDRLVTSRQRGTSASEASR
jgi:hypothetical protein